MERENAFLNGFEKQAGPISWFRSIISKNRAPVISKTGPTGARTPTHAINVQDRVTEALTKKPATGSAPSPITKVKPATKKQQKAAKTPKASTTPARKTPKKQEKVKGKHTGKPARESKWLEETTRGANSKQPKATSNVVRDFVGKQNSTGKKIKRGIGLGVAGLGVTAYGVNRGLQKTLGPSVPERDW